ncbi:metalloregulator ArsR/SmtB family transcription factor, partial [Dokdonella sp.]|uniref:ArsR/SmtB family transcription factor n=2 Tax=Dokdonella sp. TaxID=2291710 RepID=UPI0027BAA2BD
RAGAARRRWPNARGCRRLISTRHWSGLSAAAARHSLQAHRKRSTLSHMVQYSPSRFSASFAALADATRRGVLAQLANGDASISDLADRFDMTLTGMKKHVGVLELAGLVSTEKVGRVRTCRLGPCRLDEELAWLARYRRMWDARFEALDGVIDVLQRKEKARGRQKRR